MKKTILAALLCLSLLAGCSGAPAPLPEAEQPDSSPVIAYVPLDDRPDNVGRGNIWRKVLATRSICRRSGCTRRCWTAR